MRNQYYILKLHRGEGCTSQGMSFKLITVKFIVLKFVIYGSKCYVFIQSRTRIEREDLQLG